MAYKTKLFFECLSINIKKLIKIKIKLKKKTYL